MPFLSLPLRGCLNRSTAGLIWVNLVTKQLSLAGTMGIAASVRKTDDAARRRKDLLVSTR
jgi:hypothetical protein